MSSACFANRATCSAPIAACRCPCSRRPARGARCRCAWLGDGVHYNRRLLPPEALVERGAWRIIRRRQTIDDMLALSVHERER